MNWITNWIIVMKMEKKKKTISGEKTQVFGGHPVYGETAVVTVVTRPMSFDNHDNQDNKMENIQNKNNDNNDSNESKDLVKTSYQESNPDKVRKIKKPKYKYKMEPNIRTKTKSKIKSKTYYNSKSKRKFKHIPGTITF